MFTGQIVDINRESLPATTMFHFQNSLRPFILVHADRLDGLGFVDLQEGEYILWEDLDQYGLHFYEKDDDEDFCGVEIIGEVY